MVLTHQIRTLFTLSWPKNDIRTFQELKQDIIFPLLGGGILTNHLITNETFKSRCCRGVVCDASRMPLHQIKVDWQVRLIEVDYIKKKGEPWRGVFLSFQTLIDALLRIYGDNRCLIVWALFSSSYQSPTFNINTIPCASQSDWITIRVFFYRAGNVTSGLRSLGLHYKADCVPGIASFIVCTLRISEYLSRWCNNVA